MAFQDATTAEIDISLKKSWQAFHEYRKYSLKQRSSFMKAIATELNDNAKKLVATAMSETNLPEARLQGELTRTIFQLNSYADAGEQGSWLEARIDTAIPTKSPPKPDIRKMLVPIGPVVVFGASNFPLAYSVAGGDTASALAAGNPVVVKAHPAHPGTSEMVARAIHAAAEATGMPAGVFSMVQGASTDIGVHLVRHPATKAVGFTGSLGGGRALFNAAA